jgi:serine/threonine protein kinase
VILGDRYRLDEAIGHGALSTVYRARDEQLGRDVAIKRFDVGTVDTARQETELAILASLDHHGLVTMLDAGVEYDEKGRPARYIVMPLIHGIDLQDRLRGPRIPTRNIAEIGYDIAEALEYVHARNVIHRDVKPSNILLVDYGNGAARARAKLTDFGIALSEDIERLTADGTTTGTAAYLSPEQAAGAEIGSASDIYSTGLLLLQCFTRAIEYPGSAVESAVARLSRDPVIPPYVPELWRDLLRSMTARDPGDRPSAREVVSAIRQLVITSAPRHKDTESAFFDNDPGDLDVVDMLDSIPDEALHRATTMAARLFSAPISVVSIVDHDRTWLVSHYGDDVEQIVKQIDLSNPSAPREHPIVIENALDHPEMAANPLVQEPIGLRFYVGIPLKTKSGQAIGTLSVADFAPGTVSEAQLANLHDLGALIMAQLELRQEGLRTSGQSSDSIPTPAAPTGD